MTEIEKQIEKLAGEIAQAEARLSLVPSADRRTYLKDRIALEILKCDRDLARSAKNTAENARARERITEILAELGKLKNQATALKRELRDPSKLKNNTAIIQQIQLRVDELNVELAQLRNQDAVHLRELSELKAKDRERDGTVTYLIRELETC